MKEPESLEGFNKIVEEGKKKEDLYFGPLGRSFSVYFVLSWLISGALGLMIILLAPEDIKLRFFWTPILVFVLAQVLLRLWIYKKMKNALPQEGAFLKALFYPFNPNLYLAVILIVILMFLAFYLVIVPLMLRYYHDFYN